MTPVVWTDEDELAEDRRASGGEGQEGARPH